MQQRKRAPRWAVAGCAAVVAALAAAGARGGVRLGYDTPGYLAEGHVLSGCAAVLEKSAAALRRFAGDTTTAD